jgi:hypothetical protein
LKTRFLETAMVFRPRQPFNITLRLGLLAFAAAEMAKFLLERHTSLAEGPRDGLLGFLFGAAIALMLLGIWRMGRQRGPSDKPRCPWQTAR